MHEISIAAGWAAALMTVSLLPLPTFWLLGHFCFRSPWQWSSCPCCWHEGMWHTGWVCGSWGWWSSGCWHFHRCCGAGFLQKERKGLIVNDSTDVSISCPAYSSKPLEEQMPATASLEIVKALTKDCSWLWGLSLGKTETASLATTQLYSPASFKTLDSWHSSSALKIYSYVNFLFCIFSQNYNIYKPIARVLQ